MQQQKNPPAIIIDCPCLIHSSYFIYLRRVSSLVVITVSTLVVHQQWSEELSLLFYRRPAGRVAEVRMRADW